MGYCQSSTTSQVRLLPTAAGCGIAGDKVSRRLRSQLAYTLHRPVRTKFKKSRVFVQNVDDQWQADLVDMQFNARKNNGYRYLLTVIDVLSKFARRH